MAKLWQFRKGGEPTVKSQVHAEIKEAMEAAKIKWEGGISAIDAVAMFGIIAIVDGDEKWTEKSWLDAWCIFGGYTPEKDKRLGAILKRFLLEEYTFHWWWGR